MILPESFDFESPVEMMTEPDTPCSLCPDEMKTIPDPEDENLDLKMTEPDPE